MTTGSLAHTGGEFILGDSGIIRVTVNYTKTGTGTGNFMLYLNNNTNSDTASVHGNTVNSIARDDSASATSIIWNINLSTLAGISTASAGALNNSFFQLRSAASVNTTVHSILIEKLD
jgi:hypothetical protein